MLKKLVRRPLRNMFYPGRIYLLKVNNGNTRALSETCSKLTMKSSERRQWCCSGNFTHCSDVSIIDFQQVNTGWKQFLWHCKITWLSFISDFCYIRLGNTVCIYSLYAWFYPDSIFNTSTNVLIASLRCKLIYDAIGFIKDLFKWRLILCLPCR